MTAPVSVAECRTAPGAIFGPALRVWMRHRLTADIETVVPTDETVRYRGGLAAFPSPEAPDDSEVPTRSFAYCTVRGEGDTPQAAISAFQHEVEMRAHLPWRVRRVWWRHPVSLETWTDFESNRVRYLAYARFSFEPLESEAPL